MEPNLRLFVVLMVVLCTASNGDTCDCDYRDTGGCIVSAPPNFGYKCKCSYHGFWACQDAGQSKCSGSQINRGECQGDKAIGSCTGDCLGYVNGRWGRWSFGKCSHPCGGGLRIKKRRCVSPTSDSEGAKCPGRVSESEKCNTNNCVHSTLGTTPHDSQTTKGPTPGIQTENNGISKYLIVGVAIGAIMIVIVGGVTITVWLTKRRKSCSIDNDKAESISAAQQKNKSRRISLTDVINGSINMPTAKEFNDLVSFQEDDVGQRLTRYQGKRFNTLGSLNLVSSVLPFDKNRVKLRNLIDGYDYINASFISQADSEDDTYSSVVYSSTLSSRKIRMIVGQDPLPHTLHHHYSLLHENAVDFVINFNKKSLKSGKVYRFGLVTVRVINHKKMSNHLSHTEVRLFNISAPGAQYMQNTNIYSIHGWPDAGTIADDQITDIVSTVVLLRNEMKAEMEHATLMLHDMEGGIGPSAVIVSLLQLFEQIDDNLTDENKVKTSADDLDIIDTINKLRVDRANMVSSFEKYKLIYQCVEHYGNQRLAFKRVRVDDSPTISVLSKVKTSTPKPKIAENIKNKKKAQEICEEYVLHHDYDDDHGGLFDDTYDEYLLPDE